jgi:hypothetical protein
MHLNAHLAPGLGELLPGWFVLPQNPIAAARQGRVPHIGELLPASFTVPENPIIRALTVGHHGGCGACSCGGGLGQLGNIPVLPTVALLAGGLLLLTMWRPGYRRERQQAVAKVRARHPRLGTRVVRGVRAGVREIRG